MPPKTRPANSDRSIARERSSARRIGWVRLTRTIVLGSLVIVAAVYWGAEQFGMDRQLILSFLTGSLLFVAGLVVAGMAGALLLFALRRLTGKTKE